MILRILVFLLSVFTCAVHAQIKDTIFGKPKFVKEQVLFLTTAENVKLFSFEGDYGHDGFQSPKANRKKFNYWWFYDLWTHYVNTNRNYDEKGNVVSEKWFDKKNKLFKEYAYKYNYQNQLIYQEVKNSLSIRKSFYDYFGGNKISELQISEIVFPKEDKLTLDDYVRNIHDSTYLDEKNNRLYLEKRNYFTPLIGEYNREKGEEKIFELSKDSYRVEKKGDTTIYIPVQDTIYLKYLSAIRNFDEKGNLIAFKSFERYYEKLIKISDESYVYNHKNQKIEVNRYFNGKLGSTTRTTYNRDGFVENVQKIFSGILEEESTFYYNENYLKKHVLKKFDKKVNDFREYVILFKYKFDKNKNWTEITKNVDGKDLYVWKREIQYY